MLKSYIAILAVCAILFYTTSSIVGCCSKKEKYVHSKLKYYNIQGTNICYLTGLPNYSISAHIINCADIPKTATVDTVQDK